MRPDRSLSVPCRGDPSIDCCECGRLGAYRATLRAAEPGWFNAPVPSYGDPAAMLLIVGLAPGRSGANRTGIPFFGDASGDMLLGTLARFGWTCPDGKAQRGTATPRAGDRNRPPRLNRAMITNAVRCVPPGNRPNAAEIAACAPYLQATLAALPRLCVVLALGQIAHRASLRALGRRAAAFPFAHGATHDLGGLRLIDSYHCSRLNTNTGRLTQAMFEAVFAAIERTINADRAAMPRQRGFSHAP
ncbi:MAG: uracil-DNA glycosylase [Pseudomonadota bacterium]